MNQQIDTLQARAVAVNPAAVMAAAFDIEVEPGRVVRAVLDRRDTHATGAQAWVGHVLNEPLGTVTLAWVDGMVQGSVRLADSAFSIEPTSTTGVQVMRQVNLSVARPELPPLVPPGPLASAADAPSLAADDGSTIDVIVFYTPAAAGGANSRIALGVSETNTAFGNSGITPRLRLVRTQQTNYTETGSSMTDLTRFQTAGDGYMDEVQSARDAAGADLAVLVVAYTDACGLGYVMTSPTSAFADWAYSLTAYDCISPNYTFGHEIAHNLGSAHAPDDGSGQPSVYPYSFGYKDPGNQFRTVMAYDCPGGCPRLLRFSSPSGSHGGAPTGVPNQNDNAQSINNVRTAVANFRPSSGAPNTPPTISALSNATVPEDAAAGPLPFTVGDAETPAGALGVTVSSSNPTLVPNTAAALSVSGSGASRALTVTPSPNVCGSASITVTVNDGSQSASRTFTLTVAPANDAPTVSASPGSATTAPGAAMQTTVSLSDVDSPGSGLTLSASSSDPALLPNGNIATAVTGTGASMRTFNVTMTPVAGASGTAVVTFTGSDGTVQNATTFTLTVSAPGSSGAPGAPGNFQVSFTGRSVFMSWTPPTTGNPVTDYALEAGSGPGLANLAVIPLGAATSFSAGGVPDGSFWLRIRASNAAGVSPVSNELGVTMRASGGCVGLPLPITFAPPNVAGNYVTVSWSAPPPGPGPAVTSYVLVAGTQPGLSNIAVFDTGSTAQALGAAAPPGLYYLRAAAKNACGIGGPSNEVLVAVP